MERLVCLALLCVASALAQGPIDPRGARPVEHGTRADKCDTKKEWPFCTDDDWGHKCPSGCRMQGLLDQFDHSSLKKLEKIRNLLEQNRVKHRTADQASKQTYDFLKDKLMIDAGNDNNYFQLAQNIRQKVTDMKIKIDRQLRILAALKDRVKDQVLEIKRMEVDIDIKLRSCKGSCASYGEFQVDMPSYVALDKQFDQLENYRPQESTGTLYVMKSRPLQQVLVDSVYKSKDVAGQQRENVFPEVETISLILEQEGSSSSPATVSKNPGTSFSSSSASSASSGSSASSSSSSSSKSITELGGGDLFGTGGHTSTSTSTITCTKRTKTTVVHTKDGPVEKVVEVMEGGPACQAMGDFDFPDSTHASSSSSHTSSSSSHTFPSSSHTSSSFYHSSPSSSHTSSSSSNFHSGGAKGSLLGDSKGGFGNPFGDDLGGFLIDRGEDDIPDFQARGVKTTRVERQADYVGQDCVQANQNHLKGEMNGLFKIKPGGTDSTEVVEVYCQQEGLMGGWLLVQQRERGVLNFNRTWAEYRNGFGSIDAQGKGEFWLGNQNLHLLTNQGETMLKVELDDWEGGAASAEYTIRVGSEEEGYPLHVSGYSGDAGDALVMPRSDTRSNLAHDGMKFSTFDGDNDKGEENCAAMFGSGWWFNNCQSANLNGIYYKGTYDPQKNTPYRVENGIVWSTYRTTRYSLKAVRMFIRSTAF